MTKTFSKSFNKRYETLKKRYKEAFADEATNTQVRTKTIGSIDDKSNSDNSDLGRGIDELLTEITLDNDAKDLLKRQYNRVENYYHHVRFYTKELILETVTKMRGNLDLDIYQVAALMSRANKIVTGYELRPAQILSALEFFRGDENKFCQVNTGEGKTTLTSLIAVIKALQGHSVDIITSNEVLADDAVRERGDFYALFGLSVAHNNVDHEHKEGTRACYKHDIVYGTIGNFEFDFLRHRIKLSDVKGDRGFDTLIIDEADNVVLDNATHIAKLSGPVAGMEYLKYVYLNIWQTLIKAEQVLGLADTAIDAVTELDKESLKNEMSLAKDAIKGNSFIPKFLESYVDRKLDTWIKNAVSARYDYHRYQHYIVGKKDAEDLTSEDNVIPLDVGVGVTQQNTIWTDLHPFIQIKHNLQVTPDSLSSIFIANSEYIRLYKSVSGLTGTLGSQKEQGIIKILYGADSTIIPTYKASMKRYEPNKLVSNESWAQEVASDAIEHAIGQQRATLVVCETMQDVHDLGDQLAKNRQAKVIKYMDEHDAYKIESINKTGGIQPRTIVIATNIGGRGTDIKLSDTVRENGGLHECTTFIASSSRILKQASGRSARQGEPGSSKMIIRESDQKKYGITLDVNFSNEDVYDLIDDINDTRIDGFIPQIARAEQNGKYFNEFADLYTRNKSLGMNYFILEDLRLQWALAFDERNTVKIREVFKILAGAADNIQGYEHQFFNPYYAIKYIDSILSAEVKHELYDRAKRVLNQDCITQDPELLYAASMKHFEIMIASQQTNTLWQLADGIIESTGCGKGYKERAKVYLENVQQVLDQRIAYLQSIIDSEDFHQIVLLKKDLGNGGKNCILKHIESQYAILQLQYSHVNDLIKFIDSSMSNNPDGETLYISGKYRLSELLGHENTLGSNIHKEELAQARNLGEDSFYKLGTLPIVTVSKEASKAAIRDVAVLFASSAINFSFTGKSGLTLDDLTNIGIYDITKVILSEQGDQDYLLDTLSFGLSKAAKSLKILHKISRHLSESISDEASKGRFYEQFSPKITDDMTVFSQKLSSITPKGVLKAHKKPVATATTNELTLAGSSAAYDMGGNINQINSYFGKYTLDAIRSILTLRIEDAGVDNTKVVSNNYSFIDSNNNNIDDLLVELAAIDLPVILAPLNLFDRHAIGLMFIKQESSTLLYYIDPENQPIPQDLEQIFKKYQLDTKQLTLEFQRYANCGPEVIEDFMLCLTGKRLPQEEAILYHSLLVERNLLDSDSMEEQSSKPANNRLSEDLILEDIDIMELIFGMPNYTDNTSYIDYIDHANQAFSELDSGIDFTLDVIS